MKNGKVSAVMAVLIALMVSAVWAGGKSDSSSGPADVLPIRMTVRLFDQVPDMNNDYWKY